MKLIIVALVFLAGNQAFAGAANTHLNCKSADGSLEIQGEVPGDMEEFQLTVQVKKGDRVDLLKLYSYVDQQTVKTVENARIVVTDDLKVGVYTLYSESLSKDTYGFLKLYALPRTVKVKNSDANTLSWFKAKVSVFGENVNSNGTVDCTTDYSI